MEDPIGPGKIESVEITEDQQKILNKLGTRYIVGSCWNGIHHCFMLTLINVIIYMAIHNMEAPEWMIFPCSFVAVIFILKRIDNVQKRSYDKFIEEVKKVVNLK